VTSSRMGRFTIGSGSPAKTRSSLRRLSMAESTPGRTYATARPAPLVPGPLSCVAALSRFARDTRPDGTKESPTTTRSTRSRSSARSWNVWPGDVSGNPWWRPICTRCRTRASMPSTPSRVPGLRVRSTCAVSGTTPPHRTAAVCRAATAPGGAMLRATSASRAVVNSRSAGT
jgi:hypothetical protein